MTTSVSSIMGSKELIPRESLTETEKWKYMFDNATKLVAVGFLAGSGVSFLLFKSVSVRMGITTLGAGFGLGRSYVDARYILGHDVTAPVDWVAKAKNES